jgi:hypothetical protein
MQFVEPTRPLCQQVVRIQGAAAGLACAQRRREGRGCPARLSQGHNARRSSFDAQGQIQSSVRTTFGLCEMRALGLGMVALGADR